MAKSAKAPKKRATKVKKTSKKSSGLVSIWNKNSRLIVFVLLFGIVGTIFLLSTRANPRTAIDESEIAVGYYDSRPTVITHDAATNKTTYESYTASYLVLEGGTILCDDGNSEGTVYTGELGKGRVKQLQKEIRNLDLSSVPTISAANPDPNLERVSTLEGYILVNSDSINTFSVYPDGQKPDKLAKMQEKILKECGKAKSRTERGKTKEFKIPKARSSANNAGAIEKLAELVSPKVSAVAPAPSGGGTAPAPAPTPVATVSIQSTYSNHIFNASNTYRNQRGIPSFIKTKCMNDLAHLHAKRLAQQSNQDNLHHNPNLENEFVYICHSEGVRWGGGYGIAENVGVSGSSDPQVLFNAYINSPGHRANIIRNWPKVGIGTYYNSASGKYWNVMVFAVW